ncbi:50S ribosomal protein L22 [Patescibacteria group bacterium]|nr:50S ribosomal protein L22 [Patescibacteria group bacterium]
MEIKATQKFLRMSPRKLRLIVPLVKKLSPAEAFEKLPYINKRAGGPLRKVIGTAIANAKQEGITEDKLTFKEIQIGEGPRLKRWRAGARGRAKPYKKLMSHIRVVLTTKSEIRHPQGDRRNAENSKSETISNDQISKTKTKTKTKTAKSRTSSTIKKLSGKNKKKENQKTDKQTKKKGEKKV